MFFTSKNRTSHLVQNDGISPKTGGCTVKSAFLRSFRWTRTDGRHLTAPPGAGSCCHSERRRAERRTWRRCGCRSWHLRLPAGPGYQGIPWNPRGSDMQQSRLLIAPAVYQLTLVHLTTSTLLEHHPARHHQDHVFGGGLPPFVQVIAAETRSFFGALTPAYPPIRSDLLRNQKDSIKDDWLTYYSQHLCEVRPNIPGFCHQNCRTIN